MRKFSAVALLPLLLAAAPAQRFAIDSEGSALTVELGTAGLFGFLGDSHTIQAPVSKGWINWVPEDPGQSAVHVEIESASLKVLDPNLSLKDRSEVQARMESGQVLDIASFPRIVFESTRVRPQGEDLQITGNLTIRQTTRPVQVRCRLSAEGDRLKVTGESRLKQKDFGIQPVSAGGGTVKVKNEIRVTFQVLASRSS